MCSKTTSSAFESLTRSLFDHCCNAHHVLPARERCMISCCDFLMSLGKKKVFRNFPQCSDTGLWQMPGESPTSSWIKHKLLAICIVFRPRRCPIILDCLNHIRWQNSLYNAKMEPLADLCTIPDYRFQQLRLKYLEQQCKKGGKKEKAVGALSNTGVHMLVLSQAHLLIKYGQHLTLCVGTTMPWLLRKSNSVCLDDHELLKPTSETVIVLLSSV